MTWTVAGTSSGISYAAGVSSTIINSTGNGTFVFGIDMSEMTNGALFRIHLNSCVTTVTTVPKQVWCGTYQHAQLNPIKLSPPIASSGIVLNATFESASGTTTGTFPWQLLSV